MGIAKTHIEMISKLVTGKQKEYYDWILSEGVHVNDDRFRDTEFKFPIGYIAKKKACFYNAQTLAITAGLDYYEGWATTKKLGIPLEHAWNMKDGKIIDSTWKDGDEYFGVHIPTDYIAEKWTKDNMSDSLLWRYFPEKILKTV